MTDNDLADLIRSTPPRQPDPGHLTASTVIDATARLFGVEVKEILGSGRTQRLVEARQVAMAVLRANSTMSYPEMGLLFGNRDHTTVLHAVQRVAANPVLLGWAAAVDLELHTSPPPPPPERRGPCRRGGRT